MKFLLSVNRGVRHNKGVSNKDPNKPRAYDMISTRCVMLDKDGKLTDETHGVSFAPVVWDELAANAGPSYHIEFEGLLKTPPEFIDEASKAAGVKNPEWERAQSTNPRTGHTYTRGDVEFLEWTKCTEGIFGAGGRFPKSADIPVEPDKNSAKPALTI